MCSCNRSDCQRDLSTHRTEENNRRRRCRRHRRRSRPVGR